MSAGLFALLATAVFVTHVFPDAISAQQQGGADDGNQCTLQKSCRQCLVANPSCAWCHKENFLHPHCNGAATLRQLGCAGNITEPRSSVHMYKDASLTDTKIKKAGPTVQLKPQKVHLRTRIGENITIAVKFRQAEDYPVDLYYLMDLTYSMQGHKQRLLELGESLVKAMEAMTKNFRMGFGSFVDKALMPYVDTNPNKVNNPCPDNLACVAPYGFRNHMSLNNDTNYFMSEVRNANISGNLDDAEGGFDALMQVIVCQDKIKWKEEVRKIVLFATDSGFHYAGDGKLGGVVKPNDELCHLDDKGYYTESNEQDYPSIGQINRQMLAHKVNLLFAVPDAVAEQYSRLSAAIDGARMGILSDTNDIVKLINDQYQKIRSSVILTDDAPDFVKVVYRSECQGNTVRETNRCDNMTVGRTVDFSVSVTVLRCPEKKADRHFTFKVSPLGLSDTLEVVMDLYCECECGEVENREVLSPRCNESGTFECGVCLCNERYFGRFCECSVDKDSTNVTHVQQASCLPPDSTSTLLCSGNGECKCGECHCGSTTDGDMYYGPYCECNDFTCRRSSGGVLCGGRGKCSCNKCVCNDGWSGEDCGCQTATDNCVNPKSSSKALCSGEGECKCNSCQCTKTKEGQFGGLYCEECPTCTGQCDELWSCIDCEFQRRMPKARNMECPMCSDDIERKFFANLSDVAKENSRNCTFQDDAYCKYQFSYAFTADRKFVVAIYEHKECQAPVEAGFVAIAVIGGVLLIGIAIIIIMRLCMFLKDRRDYAKFLEQIKNTTWGTEENPLYKKAMTMYRNPTYGKTD